MKINSLAPSLVLSILLSTSAFSVIPDNESMTDILDSHVDNISLYKLGTSESNDVPIQAVLTKTTASSASQDDKASIVTTIRSNQVVDPSVSHVEQLKYESEDVSYVYVDWNKG